MLPVGIAPLLPMETHFDGELGAALYVSPPGGGINDIVFDRMRCLGDCWLVIDPAFDPEVYILSDAGVVIVKSPDTEIEWELPAEYLGTTFAAQVRPHEGGLELDTIYGARQITVDDEGDVLTQLSGAAVITRVALLDSGGVRVEWDWYPSVASVGPTEFVLVFDSNSGTIPENASVPIEAGVTRYAAEVVGFDDAAAYGVSLLGRATGAEDQEYDSANFTADSSGPSVSMVLEIEEET